MWQDFAIVLFTYRNSFDILTAGCSAGEYRSLGACPINRGRFRI